MIFVNYKPVVLHRSIKNSIVLTDTAESKPSTVYMDKKDVPPSNKIAWVQIVNRDYDPNDPDNDRDVDSIYKPQTFDESGDPDPRELQQDHEGNPYFSLEAWFVVDKIFTPDIPAYGEPSPDYTDEEWLKRPGVVKVIMYEHKFAMTHQLALDHVNIMNRMYWFITNAGYNYLDTDRFFNHMDWPEIRAFLTPTGMGVTIDYDDDTKSEYPPVFPFHCKWRHLSLSECLEDLLKNFDCRILSTTVIKAEKSVWDDDGNWDTYFQEASDPTTLLKWCKRKKLEYNDEVNYDRIEWPVFTEQEELDEENAVIWYPTLSYQFGASTALYSQHYGPNNAYVDQQYRSDVDFICNLFPYVQDLELTGFGPLGIYLKENRVNVKTYYQFLCHTLPVSFQEQTDWSNITYTATPDDFNILVNHLPRQSVFPQTNYTGALNIEFTGKVKEVQGSELIMWNLLDTTNAISFPEDTSIRPQQTFGIRDNDIIHGKISSETMTITSTVTDPNPDDIELIPVMFNGEIVSKIIWEIDEWNPSVPDAFLALEQNNTPNYLLDYTLVGYLTDGTFERVEYPVSFHEGYKNNVAGPSTENTMVLTFQMKNGMEEVKQFYYNLFQGRYELNSSAITSLAENWLQFYYTLSFEIGINHDVRTLSIYMNDIIGEKTHLRTGAEPEMVPSDYHIWYAPGISYLPETANTFPYTFPSKILPTVGYAYQYMENAGIPVNILAVKMYLFQRYHAWVRSHTATVSLESTPAPPPIPIA